MKKFSCNVVRRKLNVFCTLAVQLICCCCCCYLLEVVQLQVLYAESVVKTYTVLMLILLVNIEVAV